MSQRYTPVAGFEGEQRRYSHRGNESGGASQGGYQYGGASGAEVGHELDNIYTNNAQSNRHSAASYPSVQSRPVSHADPSASASAYPRDLPRADSGMSYADKEKDLPLLAGAGAGTAAGVGAGAGAGAAGYSHARGYSNPYTDNPNPNAAYNPDMAQIPHSQSLAYQNVSSETYWPEQPAGAGYAPVKKSNKKWWIIGGVVGLAAVVAIVVGVVVSQTRKSSSGSSSSGGSSSGGSGSGSGGGSGSGSSDPSVFEKDSRLHQSFWGLAYTPQGSVPPACGAVQANVTRDIQLLSQITTRLRLYSANCDITNLVLQAIDETKVDMTIWPAIYLDSNEQFNDDQAKAIEDAIKKHGTKHIEGITVGNEYLLNQVPSGGTVASPAYATGVTFIRSHIASLNATIRSMALDKHLPIGTSDAGSLFDNRLATSVDYFMANVHPYFGQLAIQDAAAWTWQFFDTNNVAVAEQASNRPAVYIAETGWPTQSLDAESANSGAGSPQGDASIGNLQTFLDTYVCQANANGTHYFYFEAFDEPWKAQYGGIEPFWGLFDKDRNLKNVTLPTC